jgi:hypothetical protein
MTASRDKKVKSQEFDYTFDKGESVTKHLKVKEAKACYPVQRISIDFPKVVLEDLDLAAAQIGVTRTALIKMWVAERLKR